MLFREKQQFTICLIAGVIVGGFVLFRYLPLCSKIKAIRQIKSAQALTIAQGAADKKQMLLLNEKLLKLQRDLKNYEAKIPEQSDIGKFLHKIADLMNEHDLSEQMIEPRKEIKTEELNCIPVKIQCKGKLAQIFEFFRQLQRLDRLVRIEQVNLSNDSDFNGRISMESKAIIYYRAKVG